MDETVPQPRQPVRLTSIKPVIIDEFHDVLDDQYVRILSTISPYRRSAVYIGTQRDDRDDWRARLHASFNGPDSVRMKDGRMEIVREES